MAKRLRGGPPACRFAHGHAVNACSSRKPLVERAKLDHHSPMRAAADLFHLVARRTLNRFVSLDLDHLGVGADLVTDRGGGKMPDVDGGADRALARIQMGRIAFSAAFSMIRIMTGVASTCGRMASLNRLARCSGSTRSVDVPFAPSGIDASLVLRLPCRLDRRTRCRTSRSRQRVAREQRCERPLRNARSRCERPAMTRPRRDFLLPFRPSRDPLGLPRSAAQTQKMPPPRGNVLHGQAGLRTGIMRDGVDGIRRHAASGLWVALLLAILAFLVIYPVLMLLLGALTDTNPVIDGFGVFRLSIDNFTTVLTNPNVGEALANTLIACGGGTAVAVIIGLTFSWIVVRTNTPCKRFIAAVSMLPLFAPPLVAGIAWVILGSPKTGLINTMFKWMGLDLARRLLFDERADLRVRRLLRALCLHVHRLRAAQHGPEPGGSRRGRRRQRVRHAVLGDVPADHAGDHLRHAAVVHRHARHLRHSGGARRADQHQRAHHLYLPAHQLVAAALQHRGRGRDPADGGDRHPGVPAAEGADRAQLHHRRRQGVPPAQPRSRARGAGSPSALPWSIC